MRKVDLVAELPHYRDHIEPIWQALPDDIRGSDYGTGPAVTTNILLVGGYSDVKRHFYNDVIYVEHGAGQSYVGMDRAVTPFYAGGPQHRQTLAFICPTFESGAKWAKAYPDRTAFVVGCPKLDPWHRGDRGIPDRKTVAVTFHWNADTTGVPETRSAFEEYFPVLQDAVSFWKSEGWTVLGHHHPRYEAIAEFWKTELKDDVEYIATSSEVLDRASVLVADNTSLQAEFLSLGRPVVYLNHSMYRRDVSHGGRFWDWPSWSAPHQTINSPHELASLSLASLQVPTRHPFAYADGEAANRAADCITDLLRNRND